MLTYIAPLREFTFVLDEFLGVGQFRHLDAFAACTPETVDAILSAAGRFCEKELLPLNRDGDEEGCHFENGTVRTPAGFKEAYRAFSDAGWPSLACSPTFGGQGQPEVINFTLAEIACATNLAFYTYIALSHAAHRLIEVHGSDVIRQVYLPPLVSGRWTATMCLTEPHCGTDLGLVRTRASVADDGDYRITGTKAFITAGVHDLTENIVHLVLARLAGAPAGTSGLSLFLVPSRLLNPDGSLGVHNGVSCGSLISKMGLHASATCILNFEDARGYLIGKPGRGLLCMRTMMGILRLTVGVQGIGLAEAAYQSARAYARERLQGHAVGATRDSAHPADPIIAHPDVRRMLLTMKAYIEGGRALAGMAGLSLDLARSHPDPAVRAQEQDIADLLTPLVKAFCTDTGFEAVNLGMQIFGGHGYARAHGMEQLVRDARLGQIYEGTNGVQALDLVSRKVARGAGRFLPRLLDPFTRFIKENGNEQEMREFTVPLAKALGRLQRVTGWVVQRAPRRPEEVAAAATDYLQLLGLVSLAGIWAKTAKIAKMRISGSSERGFYEAKLVTARFYMRHLLPRTASLAQAITAGAGVVAMPDSMIF